MKKLATLLLISALMMFSAKAAVITFTGGTATDAYNNTYTTTENGIYYIYEKLYIKYRRFTES